ncbi:MULTISPECIES: hypothetical protein [unclassified Microcoleus]|uniref:hypothetical protein n=1 Tax=unclassified Microcoleus TaxID=2642155 RepID=UPI002FD585CA
MEYMWLAGRKKEVKKLVKALRDGGFTFETAYCAEISNSPFGSNRYSYTLKNFRPPAVPTPQPRPWDAVMGGINR